MSAPTVPIRRVPVALILPSRPCLVACSMSSLANSSIRRYGVAARRVSRQRDPSVAVFALTGDVVAHAIPPMKRRGLGMTESPSRGYPRLGRNQPPASVSTLSWRLSSR
jgi:hypothetical protein